MRNQNEITLRILFATPYNALVGGIAKWADNMMNYYREHGTSDIQIELFPMGRKTDVDLNWKFRRVYYGIKEYSTIISDFRKVVKSNSYDVLHLCTSASVSLLKDLVMLRIAQKHHIRTVIHFHFGRIPELAKAKNWEWKLLRSVVRRADVVVPIDNMSFEALVSEGFTNVRYLPNPLGPKVSDFVDLHYGTIERDENMVLYAGHCIQTKGVCELVKACKDIKDIRLVLAGSISEEMKQELLDLSGREPWLEILGEQPHEEILRLMLQCGIFVLPSYTEGFPNVILESMACGCAIIATTVGAIPEMIGEEDGRICGFLVPPKNTDSLKEALCKMLQDTALRINCRCNTRERVNDRYNIESVWLKLVEIWELAASTK